MVNVSDTNTFCPQHLTSHNFLTRTISQSDQQRIKFVLQLSSWTSSVLYDTILGLKWKNVLIVNQINKNTLYAWRHQVTKISSSITNYTSEISISL